ncbi:MAG: aa3-type cytochrome c oxidase subunit IV [Pseudomonadota bacterium]
MSEHEHGKMNIKEQEKTFQLFIDWSIRISAISIGVLVFLAFVNV